MESRWGFPLGYFSASSARERPRAAESRSRKNAYGRHDRQPISRASHRSPHRCCDSEKVKRGSQQKPETRAVHISAERPSRRKKNSSRCEQVQSQHQDRKSGLLGRYPGIRSDECDCLTRQILIFLRPRVCAGASGFSKRLRDLRQVRTECRTGCGTRAQVSSIWVRMTRRASECMKDRRRPWLHPACSEFRAR